MLNDSSSSGSSEEPPSSRLQSLKQFISAGRGFWGHVPDAEWNDWRWQLKNRITTLEQLERLMPTLTPEERAGTLLAEHQAGPGDHPLFF